MTKTVDLETKTTIFHIETKTLVSRPCPWSLGVISVQRSVYV